MAEKIEQEILLTTSVDIDKLQNAAAQFSKFGDTIIKNLSNHKIDIDNTGSINSFAELSKAVEATGVTLKVATNSAYELSKISATINATGVEAYSETIKSLQDSLENATKSASSLNSSTTATTKSLNIQFSELITRTQEFAKTVAIDDTSLVDYTQKVGVLGNNITQLLNESDKLQESLQFKNGKIDLIGDNEVQRFESLKKVSEALGISVAEVDVRLASMNKNLETIGASQGITEQKNQVKEITSEYKNYIALLQKQEAIKFSNTGLKEQATQLEELAKQATISEAKLQSLGVEISSVSHQPLLSSDDVSDINAYNASLRSLEQTFNSYQSKVTAQADKNTFAQDKENIDKIKVAYKEYLSLLEQSSKVDDTQSGYGSQVKELERLNTQITITQKSLSDMGVTLKSNGQLSLIDDTTIQSAQQLSNLTDSLNAQFNTYDQNLQKIANNNAFESEKNNIKQMQAEYSKYLSLLKEKVTATGSKNFADDTLALEGLNAQIVKVENNLKQYGLVLKEIDGKSIVTSDSKNQTEAFSSAIKGLQNNLDSYKTSVSQIQQQQLFKQQEAEAKEYEQSLQILLKAQNELFQAEYKLEQLKKSGATQEQIDSQTKIVAIHKSTTEVLEQENEEFVEMIALQKELTKAKAEYNAQDKTVQSESLTTSTNNLTKAQDKLNEAMAKSGKNINVTAEALKNAEIQMISNTQKMDLLKNKAEQTGSEFLSMAKAVVFSGLSWKAFSLVMSGLTMSIENIKLLDAAMVEIVKVTGLSGNALDEFKQKAFEVGDAVGRTGVEVMEATASFARSGYSIAESLDLAETALILTNVGDGIDDVEEAATSLISVMKAYNKELTSFNSNTEKATYVLDIINEVSNNAAITFADLTEGLTRVGAVFASAGTSVEELSGLLTGTNEVLQDIEKSSTGLKTISQR